MKTWERGERLHRVTWPVLLLAGLSFCSELATAEAAFSNTSEASSESRSGSRMLRLNFHHTPLAQVLEYLSDAAGFIIEKQTEVSGTVECWSKQPVTQDEAVELLSSALKQSGCALVRQGRVLTLIREDQAKTAAREVVVGSQPEDVPPSDETVTQLIPVHYVTASQLVNNLQSLLPASATLACNESANALILVARKSEIRRILRIVQALDKSMATQSSIRVFTLRNGDAKAVAATVQQLFDASAGAQNSASAPSGAQMGNMGPPDDFGPPGMPGGPGGATDGGQSSPSPSRGKVVAVADEHSNSVIVSAPSACLAGIARVIQRLDEPAADPKELRLFHLAHADATELAGQLATLFPDASSESSGQNQVQFFAGPMPPPGMDGGNNPATSVASGSSRKLQTSKVMAIADPRTSSLMVSAAKELMPQIARMIAELDASVGRNETLGFFELKNADPQDANQVLQALFNRNGGGANNNSSQGNPLLGANNPLTTRATQQQTSSTTSRSAGTGAQGAPGGSTGGGSLP